MFSGLCECGSDQLRYLGISDVEGNTIVEEFRCEECGSAVERRTVVDVNDELDVDVANLWLAGDDRPERFPLT